jgi:hypothetical protein
MEWAITSTFSNPKDSNTVSSVFTAKLRKSTVLWFIPSLNPPPGRLIARMRRPLNSASKDARGNTSPVLPGAITSGCRFQSPTPVLLFPVPADGYNALLIAIHKN